MAMAMRVSGCLSALSPLPTRSARTDRRGRLDELPSGRRDTRAQFWEHHMTTTELPLDDARTLTEPLPRRRVALRALLACGVLASLLYVITDILGGLYYRGYSFTSQAISELAAIGAPSKPIVDPLFLMYGVLALAFAVGVLLEAPRNRPLRLSGAFLASHALVGLVANVSDRLGILPSFSMRQRGAGTLATDLPHIALTGAIVILLILAMIFGAFALGKRFRTYSFATLAVFIVFGSLAGRFGALLAAGEPTPGFGLVERIDVYSSMLWMAVLATVLLRRRREGELLYRR